MDDFMICEKNLSKAFFKKKKKRRLRLPTNTQSVLSKPNPWDGLNSEKMKRLKDRYVTI